MGWREGRKGEGGGEEGGGKRGGGVTTKVQLLERVSQEAMAQQQQGEDEEKEAAKEPYILQKSRFEIVRGAGIILLGGGGL